MEKNIGKIITLVQKGNDKSTSKEQVSWAVDYFKDILEKKWFTVNVSDEINNKKGIGLTIIIEDTQSDPSTDFLSKEDQPIAPESFVIERVTVKDQPTLFVIGADVRGLVYAILELSDIVQNATDPLQELLNLTRIKEQPANPIRSVKRLFVNEKLDKSWFYDKDFWREYLSELANQRFNRFSLALGMGYDLGHDPDIKDFYFCFAYPFLVSVPGYKVNVSDLSEDERNKNLETLRFIGQETKRRGLEFQVGIWTQAYEPEDSPDIRYKISGLNEENHAPYCRDALKTLLTECPEIDGLTIRVHYESGIPEPAHLFWKVVLEGPALSGRPVNLDLHPKGIDDELLQVAEDNGIPFTISPKFWAEHMGLPYHQAEIRETELPIEPNPEAGKMIITTTSRRFTRYGYADFFKEDRNYDIFFRIWPGTQRVLLWGDPEMAAEYGRAGSFCGSTGVELMEPLSFKSRKTSETTTGRDPYVDPSLRLGLQDWRKYLYSYRLWGRLLYNPDANPETWRRYLRNEFQTAADSCESSLKYASKILPLFTVAHSPSVANNNYWPEIYSNIMIVDQEEKPAYHCDGREPATFNHVSPLDPGLFYRVDEFTEDMIKDQISSKISPIETANLLEEFASLATQHLSDATKAIGKHQEPSFRRLAIDVKVQSGLGLFFANKFRAGTAFAFFEKVGDPELLNQALTYYRAAKIAWEQVVDVTKDVYTDDITFGYVPFMRGHWADRVQAIEDDIANMEKQMDLAKKEVSLEEVERAKKWLFQIQVDNVSSCEHTPPTEFQRGDDIKIALELPNASPEVNVKLKYRQVNQAQSYQSLTMERQGERVVTKIPSSYTDSPYPLVYYFEIETADNQKQMYPGFDNSLCNQPYFSIRQSR
ncbi:hypothetical protein ACFFHM_19010 [Halalkalibacter kiskunsagensis]|uniref:Alpha glucuronidase N-terminal domain-containing protein n=1 Tax=Halalkalibacter kiskunsagensis TaxID=1548599 RepID=A0ABV6KGR8_9BACI